jgi:DNA-binding PadR family transcriptional regulator
VSHLRYSLTRYSEDGYSRLMPSRSLALDATVPESFLPLHKDTFHILVCLTDRDRHSYSAMQDVSERGDGAVRLSPSTLYGAIKRLLEQGLIEELSERPAPEHDDERCRHYRLTRFGRQVGMAEARRLERLLADARAIGLVPRRS